MTAQGVTLGMGLRDRDAPRLSREKIPQFPGFHPGLSWRRRFAAECGGPFPDSQGFTLGYHGTAASRLKNGAAPTNPKGVHVMHTIS